MRRLICLFLGHAWIPADIPDPWWGYRPYWCLRCKARVP